MNESHVPEVAILEKNCFSIPWSERMFYDEMKHDHAVYFIAQTEFAAAVQTQKIVGYAGLWHIINEGQITNIAVAPEYRRQGIGQMLLDALARYAGEYEMVGLTLEVSINNEPAQRLYTKNGFKIEGIRKDYYSDTHEDAIIMWKKFNRAGEE